MLIRLNSVNSITGEPETIELDVAQFTGAEIARSFSEYAETKYDCASFVRRGTYGNTAAIIMTCDTEMVAGVVYAHFYREMY